MSQSGGNDNGRRAADAALSIARRETLQYFRSEQPPAGPTDWERDPARVARAPRRPAVVRPDLREAERELDAIADPAELGGRQLARFKRPSPVELVEALPRNATGKVRKQELRAPYWVGH